MTEPSAPATKGTRDTVAVALAAALLYAVSTAPGVFWGDSAELQLRAATLELSPVARGYPLHRAFAWTAGKLIGDPALGANAVSALFGAIGVALAHRVALRLSGSRVGAFAAAAALAVCPTYWFYAGVAEVYTLHAAILLALVLASIGTAESRGARLAFGALVGVSFLHHRLTVFAFPAFAVQQFLILRDARGDGRTGVRLRDLALGFAAGIAPFAALCATASRAPPADVASPFGWWIQDVFLGGAHNTAHLIGAGRKTFAANVAYLVRWIVYDLPGPALVLAAWGIARAPAVLGRSRVLFALLVPAHLVFPFRYDWTGDQFSFLLPVYVVAAPLVGIGVAEAERRWGSRAARALATAVAAIPLLVAGTLAFTPLGSRLLPRMTDEARRLLVLPVRAGYRVPESLCRARLESLPERSVLHADWGDGRVYLYLQSVDRVRPDVEVRIWYGAPKLARDGRDEWLSTMAGGPLPPLAGARAEAAELPGLHRIGPPR